MRQAARLAPLFFFACVLASLWVTNAAPISYLGEASGSTPGSGHRRPSAAQLGSQNGTASARRKTESIPFFFEVVIYVLLGAVLLALLVLLVNAVLSSRSEPPARLVEAAESSDAIEALTVPPLLVDSAERQLLALREGTPRNAIVECWRELEHSCGTTGFPRGPAETSAEFTRRMLARYQVDGSTIETLAELFREARFSVHHMTEGDREDAVTSLERILADLKANRSRSAVSDPA